MAPTPSWTNTERWAALVEGTDCPLCGRERGPDVVASLDTAIVTADETVGVPGYCCIIMKEHYIELHQLPADKGAAFMQDVQRVSAAVQSVTGAIKINYEVHGNVIPHVHMHIVPRHPGDEIERTGKPFAQAVGPAYRNGEFARYKSRLAHALGLIALIVLAACEGNPRPAEEPAIGADTAMVAAEDTTGVKACELLTLAEITAETGVEVVAGVTTNDYMGVSQCRFDRPDSTQAVMVSLHTVGDIENYRKVPGASDVSGIGDAAVWNPDTNQFAFRSGEAVASISFLFSPAESAWGRDLARIALAKMPPR